MDTDLQDQITSDLRGLITVFASPPSAEDIASGWSKESWEKWGRILCDLLERLSVGAPLPDASIARAMDFDGIAGGAIQERAAGISNSIKRLPNHG